VSEAAQGAFAPLRHRAFAVLWTAALLSNIGSWMHDVAAGWLMTTLIPSPAWVALVQAATTLPVCLLAVPAGTLADRMDRRALLLFAQGAMLLVALLLGVLVLHGLATPLTLLGVTFILGLGTAITSPAWQSILPALVPRGDLPPAVALHAVGMNIARAIGPAIGGALIVAFGIAWPFFVNAASFIAILAALWWWTPAAATPRAHTEGFFAAMRTGVAQAGSNALLRNTLLRSVMFYLFGSCYWALLPLVVHDLLGGTARLYGVLVGCIGAGAVGGALVLPRMRRRLGLHGTVVAGTWGTALALAGYATVRLPLLAGVASLLAGASWIAALSSLNVAAQLAVPDQLRARGMALYTAVFYGCLALGSIAWGQIATHAGLPATLLAASVGAVLVLIPAKGLPLTKT
jgi:MFS family permease